MKGITNELNQAWKSYQKYLKLRGEQHKDTQDALQHLAFACFQSEMYEEALQHYQKLLEIKENQYGVTHYDTLRVREHAAMCQFTLGQHEESLTNYEVLNVLCKELYPEQDLLNMYVTFGLFCHRSEQADDWPEIVEELYRLTGKILAPERQMSRRAMYAYYKLCFNRGDRQQAIAVLEELLLAEEKTDGLLSVSAVECIRLLSKLLCEDEQYLKSYQFAKKYLERGTQLLGEKGFLVFDAHYLMYRLLRELGQPYEALKHLMLLIAGNKFRNQGFDELVEIAERQYQNLYEQYLNYWKMNDLLDGERDEESEKTRGWMRTIEMLPLEDVLANEE